MENKSFLKTKTLLKTKSFLELFVRGKFQGMGINLIDTLICFHNLKQNKTNLGLIVFFVRSETEDRAVNCVSFLVFDTHFTVAEIFDFRVAGDVKHFPPN